MTGLCERSGCTSGIDLWRPALWAMHRPPLQLTVCVSAASAAESMVAMVVCNSALLAFAPVAPLATQIARSSSVMMSVETMCARTRLHARAAHAVPASGRRPCASAARKPPSQRPAHRLPCQAQLPSWSQSCPSPSASPLSHARCVRAASVACALRWARARATYTPGGALARRLPALASHLLNGSQAVCARLRSRSQGGHRP